MTRADARADQAADVAPEAARDVAPEAARDSVPLRAAPRTGVAVQPSGVFTMILLRSLEERLSPDELQELLQRAGETCTVAEFKETATSASK